MHLNLRYLLYRNVTCDGALHATEGHLSIESLRNAAVHVPLQHYAVERDRPLLPPPPLLLATHARRWRDIAMFPFVATTCVLVVVATSLSFEFSTWIHSNQFDCFSFDG